MKKKILFLILLSFSSFAIESIWKDLTRKNNRIRNYPIIIKKLIDKKMYHTSVPYLKEYLVSSKRFNRSLFDKLLEEVVEHVGDRQFVLLPEKYLKRSKAPTLRYILAKKVLRRGKLAETLKILNASIPVDHSVKPFALMLEGTVFSYKKSYLSSVSSFKRCISVSEDQFSDATTIQRKRQLLINKDYCLAGIARSLYASRNYEKAELSYLDIDKKSYIWPELLVEEAWNSFYKGDYNRTLGKLVTYNAPVMKYIFNPEIDVLQAMSYLKMCLYDDSVKVVENYYRKYQKSTSLLSKLINKKNDDLNYFFLLINSYKNGKKYSVKLVNDLLASILRDPAFLNLYESYTNGKKEISKIKGVRNRRLRRILAVNLKDSLSLQKKLIGSYVKRTLKVSRAQLQKGFSGMSYIKLEVLSRKKEQLYSDSTEIKGRGDIKYLKSNEKQYFWNFNGEFWADELGDYVFALKSECSK